LALVRRPIEEIVACLLVKQFVLPDTLAKGGDGGLLDGGCVVGAVDLVEVDKDRGEEILRVSEVPSVRIGMPGSP
jgi:hypothetical protein